MNNNSPMDYHGALGVLRTVIKERPDAVLVNEGANTLDLARGIIDMHQPRKRLDVGTWGVMGIGMGFAIAAAIETGKPVLAVEGDSAFGFSGMEVETICRYSCQSASSSSTTTASTAAPTPIPPVRTPRRPCSSRARATTRWWRHSAASASSDDAGRAQARRQRGHEFRQADPHQRGIDPAAGSESGRIGNLNPQSAVPQEI